MRSFCQPRVVVVCLMLAWLLFAPCPVAAQAAAPVPPAEVDRFEQFLGTTVLDPFFYVQIAGASLLDRLAKFPEEWQTGSGLARATVARSEQMLVGEAIGQGVAAALHHRIIYDHCECRGAFPRIGHAFGRVFTSRHDDGHVTMNISRLAGAYGSAAVADFWYPPSYGKQEIFVQATVGLALAGGVNVIKEFLFK